MQPPGSVLYVPDSMYRLREPVGATNIGVALGWKDLFDSSASWDRVIARLRRYSLASTLQAIGAVSCILNTFRSPDVAQGQSQIISWLFADPPDLGRRFQRWADRHDIDGLPQVPVLFNDLQLITAAKIAIVALDIDDEPPSTSLEPLGEALLMVSDLIDIETTRGLPPNSTLAADRERWVRYLVPNALFHFSDDFPHSLARSYDLYLTDRPHLKKTAHYVNLPKRFGRITGFDDIFPWALSFAILAHWFRCDTRSGPQPGPLDIQEYLSGFKLTDDERTRLLGFVTLDPSTARRKLLEAGFSSMNLRPFDPLPLADKPLVVINGKAYCPSVRLYRRKLTRGLHHVYAGPSIDERQRKRFLDYTGDVFEDYVHNLLTRAFPAAAGRYVGPRLLEEIAGADTKVCDGVILYPEALVLIESKATLLPLQVWAEGDTGILATKIAGVFGKAAAQIDNTIALVEAGCFTRLGIEPRRVTTYLPLVITLERLPMTLHFFEVVEKAISSQVVLESPRTQPLQAVDVADLEILEAYLLQGGNLAELLGARLADASFRYGSLRAYMDAVRNLKMLNRNPHLMRAFQALVQDVQEVVRARSAQG